MTATRIGVDIGGTFTDLLCYDDTTGKVLNGKVLTTPAAPEGGALQAVEEVVPQDLLSDAGYFLHGTTVGLNALLERRGAKVGLLTTAGFRDVIELRQGSRKQMYNAFWRPPTPLVERRVRLGVSERVDFGGQVVTPMQEDDILQALSVFEKEGVTAIAIAFLHSYANPVHELRARELLLEAGFDGAISLSHQISGEYRNYERTSTTIIDAFVQARLAGYLDNIKSTLNGSGFQGDCLITRSGGGSMTFGEARKRSFETIMSGPVAGAEGAAELSRRYSLGDLVSADVGGTSFDTALIQNGRPQLLYQGEIADMPVQSPWVDVRSIGAGGGSIAYVDEGGLLQVGPKSAGADPGPACYGRGGVEPTTSDAAFCLGMLGDGRLASGLVLNRELSETALSSVAERLGYTVDQAARGIIAIASAAMAAAIRDITVEQGVDPRELKILAFGGAGPLLATELARELDIREVIIPPYAGNFSAWGLLGADLLRDAAKSQIKPLRQDSLDSCSEDFGRLFEDLFQRGNDASSESDWLAEGALDLRYEGQEHALTIPVELDSSRRILVSIDQLLADFENKYRQVYGELLELPVEIFAVRASLRQQLPARKALPDKGSVDAGFEPDYSHMAYSFAEKEYLPFAHIHRDQLPTAIEISGPVILFEDTTTTYIDADFDLIKESDSCVFLRRKIS